MSNPGAPDATAIRQIDLRGLRCPLPVLKVRKALGALRPGEVIAVLSDDPLAAVDIPNVVRENGDLLVENVRDGAACRFVVARGEG